MTPLANGNYVVASPNWSNGGTAANAMGAVTFRKGDGTSANGVVSAANSLVGSNAGDKVGFYGIKALSKGTPGTNGNYVVPSPNWKNGSFATAGAVTCGSGTSGVSGTMSSSNSLVGSSAGDLVGSLNVYDPNYTVSSLVFDPRFNSITELANENYVVYASSFLDPALGVGPGSGAVTFRKGDCSNVDGVVSSANSLMGHLDSTTTPGVTALTGGNYVVLEPGYSDGVHYVGAAIFMDGTSGRTSTWSSDGNSNVISSSNSLVGNSDNDFGAASVTALSNGNYVVASPSYNEGGQTLGMATWGSGTSGVSGNVQRPTV